MKTTFKFFQFTAVLLLLFAVPYAEAQKLKKGGTTLPPSDLKIALELLDTGFKQPVQVVPHPTNFKRLLVVEQTGRVSIVERGIKIESKPFLDLRGYVTQEDEQGLFSIAFHPNFKENNKFYASFTGKNKFKDDQLSTFVSEFVVSKETGLAKRDTERWILRIKQPRPDHNGGQIMFGPDNILYVGLGDGGGRYDPKEKAQNIKVLLGKILRIDINDGDPYLPPPNNPFVEEQGKGNPAVWAWGFANPRTFSFDKKTGDLWAADSGQDAMEEVNLVKKGSNYGWPSYEGTRCLKTRFECLNSKFKAPIVTYGKKQGGRIIGGYVYRGYEIPELYGVYVYADYISGKIWGLKYDQGKVVQNKVIAETKLRISGFGQDLNGELYITAHERGELYRLVAKE